MLATVQKYCSELLQEFGLIPVERKILLETISVYIADKLKDRQPVRLVYICTHNSRRSHFGQVWAKIAADHYGLKNISTFSGGTEATAFHINALNALKRTGLVIRQMTEGKNPAYQVFHDEKLEPSLCFSKVYNDVTNPNQAFAVIMTCSDAEENCPFIPGAELRTGTTYDDPKIFDGTPLQDEKYDERCRQIAREIFYVFSKVG
jgi:protein-tyrosine phosphatase/arsenate reductase